MDKLEFNISRDLRIIPYSPVTEKDNVEFRLQIFNTHKKQNVTFNAYIDEKDNLLFSSTISVDENSFGYVKFFKNFLGQVGAHKIIVCVDTELGQSFCAEQELVVNKLDCITLDGGFIVITLASYCDTERCGKSLDELTDDDWKTIMDEYNRLGFKAIVIQTSIGLLDIETGKEGAYYNGSKLFDKVKLTANDPIDAILSACENNGQKVFIGMCSPHSVNDFNVSQKIMGELYDRFGKYSSFYGWYSSWEFSMACELDCDFPTSMKSNDLRKLREVADEISPVMPILYSPYLSSFKDGEHKRGTAESILKAISEGRIAIDILAPHDHCGQAHKLSNQKVLNIEDAIRIYADLKFACDLGGMHLWANCEGFNLKFNRTEKSLSGYHKYDNALVPRFIGGYVDEQSGLMAHIAGLRPYIEKSISFMLTSMFQKPNSSVIIGNDESMKNYNVYKNYLDFPFRYYDNKARGKSYTLVCDHEIYEPDNGYTFYDQFDYSCIDMFHPDKQSGGLLTDGLMLGGMPENRDTYLSLGTALERYGESCTLDVTIDLEKAEDINKVRFFAPLNRDFSPDRVMVYVSNDNQTFNYYGENSGVYINGYAEVYNDRKMRARYVKLSFFKVNGNNWKNWLILDEIEVL